MNKVLTLKFADTLVYGKKSVQTLVFGNEFQILWQNLKVV